MAKAKNAELLSIKIKCPKDGKKYLINEIDLFWRSSAHECEMCGSHGSIGVDFTCKCGDRHNIDDIGLW